MKLFTRACRVTLKFATVSKRRKINALLESYRSAVNFYIKSLWETRGSLDKATLARLADSCLSQRYRSQALKQALETVVSTRKALKATRKFIGSPPVFTGSAVLDSKFVSIEDGRDITDFNLIIRLSTLSKGKRISIPTRRTKILDKWLSFPQAELIQGCALSETGITLFVEIPEILKSKGDALGVDIGVNKLLSDSEGNHYGVEFKTIRDKILRKKPKSKAKQRALRERDNLISREVNRLPWSRLSLIAVEDLTGIKFGKRKDRSRSFRRAQAPWTVRQVVTRIENKAQENRVRLVAVDPRNTSRTCPRCGVVDCESRKGELFCCVSCRHQNDADTNGAINILAKALSGIQSSRSHQRSLDISVSKT